MDDELDKKMREAFERIGLNSVAGYQMKSARRSLNILFQEWVIEVFTIGK